MTREVLTFLALITAACLLIFAAGWLVGARGCKAVKLCSAWHRCILKQRKDVRDWTGEITREMQRELAHREGIRSAIRKAQALADTGENPAIPESKT
jgi:hypothetical protein